MSTSAPTHHDAHRTRIFGKKSFAFLIGLLIVLAVCLTFSWITRSATVQLAYLRAQDQLGGQSIVSTRTWQTAQALAATASTYQAAQYAREAERLADHEVDQAFAAALRSADMQTRDRVLTGRTLALSQRVTQLQQEIAQDKLGIQHLKAQSVPPAHAAKGAAQPATESDALQVAEAQLGLDSDELTDTQNALSRATGDLTVRIKNELAAHEAAMSKYDSEQAAGTPLKLSRVKNPLTLAGLLKIWSRQSSRQAQLQQARAEALTDARVLTTQYNKLEAQVNAASFTRGTATLTQIQDRRTQRQLLFINADRIQTNQQLAVVYGKWSDQVTLQRHIILHLVLRSLEIILAIILCMILVTAIVRRLMSHPSLDRRRAHTLRTIFVAAVQIIGLLLIALVIFGPPHGTGTIIGLITAALAIALQDYILAFLGWFMLAGKNGIHVGDMVEINKVCGEVIEIGLISTTLLETTGLAEKGEPTGRSISFLNSFAIRGTCFNFSTEGQWLWDEITISVPASADVYAIAKSVEEAACRETEVSAHRAELEWNRDLPLSSLNRMSAAPIVMMSPSIPLTDLATSIDIQVRYVTGAVGRYEVRDRLYKHVIEMLQEKKQLPETAAVETP